MRDRNFHRLFPRIQGRKFAKGPMIAADHLSVLLNRPLIEVCQSGALLAEGLLKAQMLYGSEFIIVFFDVSAEIEAMGAELEYPPNRNPHPVKLPEFDDILALDITERGRIPELFKAARICRKELGDDFPIFFSQKDIFSLAAMLAGAEDFLSWLISDLNKVEALLNICGRTQMMFTEKIVDTGFIPFIGAPLASGDLIGGAYFERYAKPYLKKLLDLCHVKDSLSAVHICGSIIELTEQLSDLKPDILSFEDSNIMKVWDKFPDIIPMGYIPTELFVQKDIGAIGKISRKCAVKMQKDFILSTGCDLPMKADPEFVKAMMILDFGN